VLCKAVAAGALEQEGTLLLTCLYVMGYGCARCELYCSVQLQESLLT